MAKNTKALIGLLILFLPPALVFYLSESVFFESYKNYLSNSVNIPALNNFSSCGPVPERIVNLHCFNIVYVSVVTLLAALFWPIKNSSQIQIKQFLLSVPLFIYSVLILIFGVNMREVDGAAKLLSHLYCDYEVGSFVVTTFLAFGSGIFMYMFFAFLIKYFRGYR